MLWYIRGSLRRQDSDAAARSLSLDRNESGFTSNCNRTPLLAIVVEVLIFAYLLLVNVYRILSSRISYWRQKAITEYVPHPDARICCHPKTLKKVSWPRFLTPVSYSS